MIFAKRWRYDITCLIYKRLSFLYSWLLVQDIQYFPPMECSSSIPLMKFNCLRHHGILLPHKKNHEMPKLGAQHVIALPPATAFCLKWYSANLPTYLNPDTYYCRLLSSSILACSWPIGWVTGLCRCMEVSVCMDASARGVCYVAILVALQGTLKITSRDELDCGYSGEEKKRPRINRFYLPTGSEGILLQHVRLISSTTFSNFCMKACSDPRQRLLRQNETLHQYIEA
jgi:hypothetical protein